MKKLLLCACALLLSGCEEDDNKKIHASVPHPTPVEAAPDQVYQNNAGQFVDTVLLADLKQWLYTHKDCELVLIVPLCQHDSSSNAQTNGLVIVYKRKDK